MVDRHGHGSEADEDGDVVSDQDINQMDTAQGGRTLSPHHGKQAWGGSTERASVTSPQSSKNANKPRATATRDFSRPDQGATPFLTVKPGDVVIVLKEAKNGWIMATPVGGGKKGYVPDVCLDLTNSKDIKNIAKEAAPTVPVPTTATTTSSQTSSTATTTTAEPKKAKPVKKQSKPMYYARATRDFSHKQTGGTPFLTIKKGDVVGVLKQMDKGWCLATFNGQTGYVPILCVERVPDEGEPGSSSDTAPQSKAASLASTSSSYQNTRPTSITTDKGINGRHSLLATNTSIHLSPPGSPKAEDDDETTSVPSVPSSSASQTISNQNQSPPLPPPPGSTSSSTSTSSGGSGGGFTTYNSKFLRNTSRSPSPTLPPPPNTSGSTTSNTSVAISDLYPSSTTTSNMPSRVQSILSSYSTLSSNTSSTTPSTSTSSTGSSSNLGVPTSGAAKRLSSNNEANRSESQWKKAKENIASTTTSNPSVSHEKKVINPSASTSTSSSSSNSSSSSVSSSSSSSSSSYSSSSSSKDLNIQVNSESEAHRKKSNFISEKISMLSTSSSSPSVTSPAIVAGSNTGSFTGSSHSSQNVPHQSSLGSIHAEKDERDSKHLQQSDETAEELEEGADVSFFQIIKLEKLELAKDGLRYRVLYQDLNGRRWWGWKPASYFTQHCASALAAFASFAAQHSNNMFHT